MMWWIPLAAADPPDGNPGRIQVGSGAIERMVISSDDELVAGRDRATGNLWVLPVDSWEPQTAELPCGVTGVALVPSTLDGASDDAQDVFVSCDDGSVHWWIWSDELLQPVYDSDLEENTSFGITVDGDPFKGIWWNGTQGTPLLYMYEDVGAQGYMHVLSPYAGTVNGTVNSYYQNNPQTFAGGFKEGVVDNGTLYVAHGSGRTTLVNLATGNVTFGGLVTAAYGIDDIASGNGKLWAVDTSNGYLFEYRPQQGTFGIPYTGFDEPQAVVASTVVGDEWLMVSGLGIWIYQLSGGNFVDFSTPTYQNLDADINIQDAVANAEYTFGGGGGGNIQIITARPWVEATASTTAGTTGDVFDLTFTVDDPSNWVVTRGGDRTGNGSVITAGTTTARDETVTVSVTINDNWAEGDNRIYAVATNSRGYKGHDRVDVTIDGPPKPPELTDANVGFANGALVLSFDGIEDEDLASYSIWISDQEWTSADAPPPAPDPGPETPITVAAEPGATVTVRLAPLVNGTTYYIGVRATDTGGQESSMSNVVQGVPEEDYRASDLAGETGGGPCATGPSGGWLAGALAGMALFARRRRGVVLGGAALLCALPAHAADDKGDLGPQRGDFEIRYGGFLNLADENIKSVYGEGGHNMLQVEFGPQIVRFFELDIEVGFYQELATTVSASGSSSDVKTMLTWYPLGLSGSFRLQILDEQIIVPYARLGADFVPWTELTDNAAGGKDKVSGSKLGHHYAIGGGILLDTFAPARASLLEAQTGINDTYITIEWRRQNIDSRNLPWAPKEVDGFDFSGSMLTVGLKLDY